MRAAPVQAARLKSTTHRKSTEAAQARSKQHKTEQKTKGITQRTPDRNTQQSGTDSMVLPSIGRGMSVDSSTSSTRETAGMFCGMQLCSDGNCCTNDHGETSLLEQGNNGELPLHRALTDFSLQSIADPDNVTRLEQHIKEMVQSWPNSVDVFNNQGMTALHIACKEGAPLSVIMDLVNAKPSSVETATRNKQKMLPLHLVCRYYSGPAATMCQVVQFLLRVHPDAARCATGAGGELALHLCCQNYFCTVPLLELLVQAYPEAVRLVTHKKRQLPLHLACERHYFQRSVNGRIRTDTSNEISSSSHEIIRYLVESFTESVAVYDKKGELPFHTAVRGYQTPETIMFLLSVFPDSIHFSQDTGRTALHICVTNAVPDLATLTLLLEADASASTVVDDEGKIPLQYAVRSKNLDLIYTLIGSFPSSLEALRHSIHDQL